jgi:hypothetical protein
MVLYQTRPSYGDKAPDRFTGPVVNPFPVLVVLKTTKGRARNARSARNARTHSRHVPQTKTDRVPHALEALPASIRRPQAAHPGAGECVLKNVKGLEMRTVLGVAALGRCAAFRTPDSRLPIGSVGRPLYRSLA